MKHTTLSLDQGKRTKTSILRYLGAVTLQQLRLIGSPAKTNQTGEVKTANMFGMNALTQQYDKKTTCHVFHLISVLVA